MWFVVFVLSFFFLFFFFLFFFSSLFLFFFFFLFYEGGDPSLQTPILKDALCGTSATAPRTAEG